MPRKSAHKRVGEVNPRSADFVIITALEEERDAVLNALGKTEKLDKEASDVHTYYRGTVRSTRKDRSRYDVIVACLLSMGPTDAAILATHIVKRWKPKYVLLVGIACGIRGEANHGDILIANQVADYTLGKQEDGRRKIRWTVTPCGASLLDSAVSLSKKWRSRIALPRPEEGEPLLRKGVVASGGDVVADDQIVAAYSEDWPKLVGIEMEAGGVAAALHQTSERPEFLMIKSVSDFGADKHDPETRAWRSYACHAAAAFAHGVIESGPSAKVFEEIRTDRDGQDAELKAAERRWAYLQNSPLRGIEILFVLKSSVGQGWLRRILEDTHVRFSHEGSSFALSTAFSLAPAPNTKERSARWEEATCSFWEIYQPDPSYRVRRTAPEGKDLPVVAGFDATIPWNKLAVDSVRVLGDLAPLAEIGIGIPPEAFTAGVEEFKLTFVGDQFSFSLALSDHGLEFLHEMAGAHVELSRGGKSLPLSLGTGLSGIQLLETFREQSLPNWKPARHANESVFGGMGGSGGKSISFYPGMPRTFHNSAEAQADYTIKLGSVPDLEAGKARVRELESVVRGGSADAETYGELAARYARGGRLAEAIQCLEQGTGKLPLDVDLLGLLGETLADLGRFEDALVPVRQAEAIAPDHAGIQSVLACCLAELGNDQEALPHFEAAANLEPSKARHHSNLGRSLAVQERYSDAIAPYERALELAPDNVENLELLGVLYSEVGRTEDAERCFAAAVEAAPNNAGAHENLGRHRAITEDYANAIPILQRALELEETASRFELLGSTFGHLAQWPEAEASIRQAVSLDPENAKYLKNLGICVMKQERYGEAIEIFERHLQLDSADVEISQLIDQLREGMAEAGL